MFWGKNIKGGECIDIDNHECIGKWLSIGTVTIVNGEEGKYGVSVLYKGEWFQLVSLGGKNDCMTLGIGFEIEKGMKMKVEGGKKGCVCITGNIREGNGGKEKEDGKDEGKEICEKKEQMEVVEIKNTPEKKGNEFLGKKTKMETPVQIASSKKITPKKNTPNKQYVIYNQQQVNKSNSLNKKDNNNNIKQVNTIQQKKPNINKNNNNNTNSTKPKISPLNKPPLTKSTIPNKPLIKTKPPFFKNAPPQLKKQ